MKDWNPLKSLLWKNWLLWRRSLIYSLCELLCPLVFLSYLVLNVLIFPGQEKHSNSSYIFRDLSQITTSNNSSWIDDPFLSSLYNHSWPFAWSAAALSKGQKWAIGIVADLSNTTQVYAPAMTNCIVNSINESLRYSYYPPYVNLSIVQYNTWSEVQDIITSSDYDDPESTKFSFVIELLGNYFPTKGHQPTADVELVIRYNATSIIPADQSLYGYWYPIFELNTVPQLNAFDQSQNTDPQQDFMDSGFLQLMNIVQGAVIQVLLGGKRRADISVGFVPMKVAKYEFNPMLLFAQSYVVEMVFVATVIPVLRLISKVTSEKQREFHSLLRAMGLSDWIYNVSWWVMYLCIYVGISVESTLACVPLFWFSNKLILFLIFLLYGCSCLGFSMLVSAMIPQRSTAILSGLLLYIFSSPSIIFAYQTSSIAVKLVLSLFPIVPLSLGFETMLEFEQIQEGVNWTNIGSEFQGYSVGTALLFLSLDTLLFIGLSLYFDKLTCGRELPFYFPFTKKFWVKPKELDAASQMLLDREYEENQERMRRISNLEAVDSSLLRQHESGQSMRIRRLSKIYDKAVVNGVDLDMYEGEIFALVGPNGAGKTTTISMITGQVTPTSGEIHAKGYNSRTDLRQIQQQIGICPQANVFFNDLTVYEHLRLFAIFKGITTKLEIEAAVSKVLATFGLQGKKYCYPAQLSGGQQRQLSLSIALVSRAEIVILDEPTTGMDSITKKQVWTQLKSQKSNRIIVLTTHSMEEAEFLSDRIAIIVDGQIKSVGTPMFLKSRFGVGYTLTVHGTNSHFSRWSLSEITSIVKRFVPEGKATEETGAVVAQLPLYAADMFEGFFSELSIRSSELEVQSYSLAVTTLESAFLRVVHDSETRISPGPTDILAVPIALQPFERIEMAGLPSAIARFPALTQVWVLLRFRFTAARRSCVRVFCELIIPSLILLSGFLTLENYYLLDDERSLVLSLTHLSTPQEIAFGGNWTQPPAAVMSLMDSVINSNAGAALGDFMPGTPQDFYNYTYETHNHKRMGAYFFTEVDPESLTYHAIVYQSTSYLQACPLYYSLLGEAVLQQALDDPSFRMTTVNHPLPLTQRQTGVFKDTAVLYLANTIAIGLCFVPTSIIRWLIKERIHSVKTQLILSGVSRRTYWASAFLLDFGRHSVLFVMFLVCLFTISFQRIIVANETLACVAILFVLLGCAQLPGTYCVSFFWKTPAIGQIFVMFFSLVTGVLLPTVSWLMRLISQNARNVNQGLQYVFRLSPLYCFSYGFINAVDRDLYRIIFEEKELRGAMDWEIAGADIAFLAIEAVCYSLFVLLIERRDTLDMMQTRRDLGSFPPSTDPDIVSESEVAHGCDPADYSLVLIDLAMKLSSSGSTDTMKMAFENVSLRVKRGETIGLIGANGSGKTSLLKVITGEMAQSKGEVYIDGKSVQSTSPRIIGYCPQSNPLIDLLTVREHLTLYASIQFTPSAIVPSFVQDKMLELSLDQYADVLASKLSGGTKRKLSVAIATIGGAKLVLMDEPTAGMDPGARKKAWTLIRKLKGRGTSVMLTTHSLDEAETLSDRLAILCHGRLQSLGSPVHLKVKFGSGLELEVKLRDPLAEEVANGVEKLRENGVVDRISVNQLRYACLLFGNEERASEIAEQGSGFQLYQELTQSSFVSVPHFVEWFISTHLGDRLTSWLSQEFPSPVPLVRGGAVWRFRIENGARLESIGSVFGKIESVKRSLGIVEYSVGETGLEQVFTAQT